MEIWKGWNIFQTSHVFYEVYNASKTTQRAAGMPWRKARSFVRCTHNKLWRTREIDPQSVPATTSRYLDNRRKFRVYGTKSVVFQNIMFTAVLLWTCFFRLIHIEAYCRVFQRLGGGGDTMIPSPGMAPKQPLPGIGLHDPLHGRQACPEFHSFHQGVGQISLPEGLFSCRPFPIRRQICYIPAPPQSLNGSV